jgi:hypothetical protein
MDKKENGDFVRPRNQLCNIAVGKEEAAENRGKEEPERLWPAKSCVRRIENWPSDKARSMDSCLSSVGVPAHVWSI